MELKLALAGDTMLGRGVAERLRSDPPAALFAPELIAAANEADLFVLNLECCVSTRGERWPDPHKPFLFRAPPAAARALHLFGVDCVTLANNHALDYGPKALLDAFDHLDALRHRPGRRRRGRPGRACANTSDQRQRLPARRRRRQRLSARVCRPPRPAGRHIRRLSALAEADGRRS